ncbi:MAG: DNA repair protein RadC [Ignavibacteria bacterium]
MEIKVCDLPASDRPLNRLIYLGSNGLTNIELLSIIIGTSESLSLAENLLLQFKTLECIRLATIQQLTTIKGIGISLASRIIACLEMSKRLGLHKALEEPANIQTPEQCFREIISKIINRYQEHFYVCSLNVRNKLIAIDEVSKGTLTSSLVHPREVFETAIKRHSAQIIVAHNHPSGDVSPSEDDIKITKRLYDASKIMGIELLDHLIVTENKYTSLKEKGIF